MKNAPNMEVPAQKVHPAAMEKMSVPAPFRHQGNYQACREEIRLAQQRSASDALNTAGITRASHLLRYTCCLDTVMNGDQRRPESSDQRTDGNTNILNAGELDSA
jgi:hypothetical protein